MLRSIKGIDESNNKQTEMITVCFTLSMPGSRNRKHYIIGMRIYYILLVYHLNAISTSCFCVVCHHCRLLFSLAFLLPIVDLLLVLSTLNYSTILIYFVAVPPCREENVLGVVKKEIICHMYNYFEQPSKKQVATVLKYSHKTAEAIGFARRTEDKIVRERQDLEGGEFFLPANRIKESRVKIDVDSFDVDAIRHTVHKFYDQKEYPTLDSLLKVLKEKELFNGGQISLWKLLLRIDFRYKKVNGKRCVRAK